MLNFDESFIAENKDLLAQNKDGVKALADTADGRAVRQMLAGRGGMIKSAVKSGDSQQLQELISGVLSTPEGKNIASQLTALLGKQQ
ncbi:MAG: hypothetical protein LBO63_03580 [Oscillospiraceae bacterium]|jgi:hypothetical protein|nr:hypothetical protein [Oscillospiraceae bacterium]